MRVLFLMPRVSWPPNTGLMLRNYHLARALSRVAEVSCLSFDDDQTEVSAKQAQELPPSPETWAQQVITVQREAAYTPAKILRGAVGSKPVTVLNYTTPAMSAALAKLLQAQRFDVVQVETSTLGAYLPVLRAAPHRPLAVCDWHNIDSELMARYADKAPLPRRFYARLTTRRIAAFERWTLQNYDAQIACSERDAEQLRAVTPTARVSVIENGVDVEYYTGDKLLRAHQLWQAVGRQMPESKLPTADDKSARRSNPQSAIRNPQSGAFRILYVGSMDYHANTDAVIEFARRDWPHIYQQRPELTFTIVGRKPTPEVQALAQLPGVEVTGTVPDVRPYYAEAAAQVVPLRVGSGSRLKILEAMAAGVPVVSTTLGAEGLAVRDGENIALADTPEAMARALFALLDNPALHQQRADAARALVKRQYDWSALGAALGQVYQNH